MSGEQKADATRIAQSAGLPDWKAALSKRLKPKVFAQAISEPRIAAPSWAREVTAPTAGWGNHD